MKKRLLAFAIRALWRGACLVGFGWIIDHALHTGWLVAICLLSVIDRELDWLAELKG